MALLKITVVFKFLYTHWAAAVRRAQELEDSFEKICIFLNLLDMDEEGEDDMDIRYITEQVLGL
jgi:hypothetical protein